MKKAIAITAALFLVLPAWTFLPLLFPQNSSAASTGPVFSADYSEYTIDMSATPTPPDQVAYVLRNYRIDVGGSSIPFFDKIGIDGFRATSSPSETATGLRYSDSALDLRIHNIPSASIEMTLLQGGKAYVDLAGGISAVNSAGGVIIGGNNVSGIFVIIGQGSFSIANDLMIVVLGAGSKAVFRATPPGEANIAESILGSRVSGEMFVSASSEMVMQDNIALSGIGMEAVLTSNRTFTASIEGDAGGRALIINLDRSVLPDLDTRKIAISVGGQSAKKADNAASLLWETGGAPKFYVSLDGQYLQVLVYIPAGSASDVVSIGEEIVQAPGIDTVMSAIAAVLVVVVAAAALYKR